LLDDVGHNACFDFKGVPDRKRCVGRKKSMQQIGVRISAPNHCSLYWADLGVDGWIILGWISRRWDVGIWTGLGWPRIGTGGGRL